MIYVIQCAGSKRPDAGTFRTVHGRSVSFVARPEQAPPVPGQIYALPDDQSDQPGQTWRQLLTEMNKKGTFNSPSLLPAGQLYTPAPYATLVKRFGSDKVFILSAGWGLVRSDFLLPTYDITFANSAEAYKRRGKQQRYADYNFLPSMPEDIVFLGGKDYLPLFLELTASTSNRRIVFYNSLNAPRADGCETRLYRTARRTNWHYELATKLSTEGNSHLTR